MRYSTICTIDPAITLLSTYVFRANNLSDPDFSAVGHQPRGFDQYAAYYNNWVVIGSVMQAVPIFNNGNQVANGTVFGILVEREGDPSIVVNTTSFSEIREMRTVPYVYYTRPPENDTKRGHLRARAKFSAKRFFSENDLLERENNGYWGTFATVPPYPPEPPYSALYRLWYRGIDPNIDPPAVTFMVDIDFIVLMMNPKLVGPS